MQGTIKSVTRQNSVATVLFYGFARQKKKGVGDVAVKRSTNLQSVLQGKRAKMKRGVLQVALLAAAASCVLAEKGDLYGKDGPQKESIVEQVRTQRRFFLVHDPSLLSCPHLTPRIPHLQPIQRGE